MTVRSNFKGVAGACALALVVVLGGCDMAGDQPDTMQTGGLSYDQSTKLSGYSRALIDFDPRRLKREFEERDISKATAADTPFVDVLGVENPWDDLRRTRAMPGNLPEIDPLVDQVLAPLQRLTSRAKGLQSYLTMRSYLTDDFARARQEAPQMIADYDAVIAATDELEAKVNAVRAAVESDLMQRLKSEGHMASYYDMQIAQEARELSDGIPVDGAMDDAAVGRMETIINRLIPLLDQARAARAEEASKAGDEAVLDNGVVASAESMIGAWREYRQSQDADDLQRMREAASNVLRSMA
ncbi:DUF3829 domain-containing protein [Altererythrobacter xixiisoli]|uniref:DUF3829 domain-containing protein n=1 Tax=Croceibacterium xixiisoli TaxID=1476466 RepID=A0A6I4TUF1_9SPHN|nr:DUF3829 domain-containing protein [Croceibacterium xixiisoli]MXO99554.1 DUF3829 domain-containing protein [Croceibacterium xixiisoli]